MKPPAEALIACPDIPQIADNSADTLAIWGGEMIDLYASCRAKHDAVREWHK